MPFRTWIPPGGVKEEEEEVPGRSALSARGSSPLGLGSIELQMTAGAKPFAQGKWAFGPQSGNAEERVLDKDLLGKVEEELRHSGIALLGSDSQRNPLVILVFHCRLLDTCNGLAFTPEALCATGFAKRLMRCKAT